MLVFIYLKVTYILLTPEMITLNYWILRFILLRIVLFQREETLDIRWAILKLFIPKAARKEGMQQGIHLRRKPEVA